MNQISPGYLDKHVRSLRTFLERWRGGVARLWEFQAAHSHLTLRIEQPGKPGNLHVICLGPVCIHGPVQWEPCALEVHVETDGQGDVEHYILRDAQAHFEVITEEIEVKEHGAPLS